MIWPRHFSVQDFAWIHPSTWDFVFVNIRLCCVNLCLRAFMCILNTDTYLYVFVFVFVFVLYTDTYLSVSGGSSLFLARSINTCFSQVTPFLSPTNNGGEFWKGFLIFIDSLFPPFSSLLELNSICHPLLQFGRKLDEKGNDISCSSF